MVRFFSVALKSDVHEGMMAEQAKLERVTDQHAQPAQIRAYRNRQTIKTQLEVLSYIQETSSDKLDMRWH